MDIQIKRGLEILLFYLLNSNKNLERYGFLFLHYQQLALKNLGRAYRFSGDCCLWRKFVHVF